MKSIALLIALFALTAQAQESQLIYDASGNLVVQNDPGSGTAPQILSQPQSQMVAPGELASFFVIAADTRSLTYQWRFNGTNLSGATGDTLLLTNVTAVREGLYSVMLANSSGSVTSAPAALWVDSDGDGLSDTWETTYFTNLNQNPGGDFDNDGVLNLVEFKDGTIPTNNASALYRVFINSDGGSFVFSPNKPNFTNGEVVTVTAVPAAQEKFHGWTGDAVTTNNPIVLTMTTNRFLTAYFNYYPIYWTNTSGGDWHNATNWSPNLVPAVGDTAVLNISAPVAANNSAECGTLLLGAPGINTSITGSGTLTVHSNGVWASGNMTGTGRTIIGSNATFTINNPGTIILDTRTLENAGTILWTGADNSTFQGGGAVITNRAGALFEVRNNGSFGPFPANSRFDNAGTFRKTTGSGTTTFAVNNSFGTVFPFNNYGTTEIQSGTLLCNATFVNNGAVTVSTGATLRVAAGGIAGGTFTVSPGALVDWTGGTFTVSPGALLSGSGLYKISGGTVALNTDLAVENLDLSATLDGSGRLTVNNVLNWTAGSMNGGGRTIIAPGATNYINNVGTVFLNTRTLENAGTILWTGADSFNIQCSAAVITNRPGALLEVRNNGSFYPFPASSRFDNAGTFRKTTGSGTTTFAVNNSFGTAFPFNNYGTTEVQAGTLLLNATCVHNGAVTISPGATLRVAAGGSASGTFTSLANALVDWSGGTFTVSLGAMLSGSGLYKISGGTVAFNTDMAVQNLDLSATLDGSGRLTVSNLLNWTAGSMNGSGRTIIAPGATNHINNVGTVFLNTRTLENAGTILWTGADNSTLQAGGAVITNRAGALFEVRNNANFGPFPSSSRFDNAGIFRKTTGSGTTTFTFNNSFQTFFPFNNYGSTEIQTGTLLFTGTFANNGAVTLSPGTTLRMSVGGSASGTFTNPATALVDWTGGTFTVSPGALLSGSGLYKITSGTVAFNTDLAIQNLDLSATLDGNGRLTVNNVMNWTAGSMIGSGRTIIAPGATNYIANTSTVFLNTRTLENAGTVLWMGTDGASLQCGGAVITNCAGALFEVRNNANFGAFPGNSRFDNAGILRKTTASGTTGFTFSSSFGTTFPFNNYGALDIRKGIIAATAGYTSGSGASLSCTLGGTTAGSGFGQLQVGGTATLNGRLSVDLLPGFIPATNDTFTVVSAGTRNGAFTSFTYPSNIVAMQLTNTTTSVILRVTDITLTNGAPVVIGDLPVSQLFYDGRIFSLPTRVAGGQPFTFQWQKDGTNLTNNAHIAGADAATLFVTNALRAFDSGSYRLLITNSEGSATSRVSAVTIQAVPKLNAAGAGWSLQGTTLPPMNSNNVTLTAGLGSTSRNVFYKAPLYIAEFHAKFVYVDVGGGGADGMTFCLHNDSRGAATLGGGGGGLGYAGITPSAALALNIYQTTTRGISLRTNGTLPASYSPSTPVNLASGNPIHVSLLYTGGVLRATLVESNTANTFTTNLSINLPAIVGAETAYVGFTGGDAGLASTQVVSNFTFVPITGIDPDHAGNTLAMSWPASIGGYTMQTTSNLSPGLALWQNVSNTVNQFGGKNRVTVSPLEDDRFYQLSIKLEE